MDKTTDDLDPCELLPLRPTEDVLRWIAGEGPDPLAGDPAVVSLSAPDNEHAIDCPMRADG